MGEDYDKYPRDVSSDVRLIEESVVKQQEDEPTSADIPVVVFAPSVQEMYGQGFSTKVDVGAMSTTSEALARPQFFAGVTTVVSKLFNIALPHAAYFGQKDALQVHAHPLLLRTFLSVITNRASSGLSSTCSA